MAYDMMNVSEDELRIIKELIVCDWERIMKDFEACFDQVFCASKKVLSFYSSTSLLAD
jgi:hypothetical protein